MPESTLLALSPLDGRYRAKLDDLAPHFSEFGLIRARLRVELGWLCALAAAPEISELPPFSAATQADIARWQTEFSVADAARVKALEAQTNHDVKALEYWIQERAGDNAELKAAIPFVHFACTSEDINNLAYALNLDNARRLVLLPALDALTDRLLALAHQHAAQPMLSRTHGQPATPTTLGKEMANVVHRLKRARAELAAVALAGKINGAVGNYNAHIVAYPEVDWPAFARRFVEGLGLEFNPYTIQIEPHDSFARCFDALARINSIVLDLARDLWGYIAIGYFRQRPKPGEVGSSTMPHKVNPIDFENAEGNLGVANALLRHLSDKLPISRWQRDLSDSTTLRNIGVALGHSLLAWRSCMSGLDKLEVDARRLNADLAANWEVLAEAIQTVMRRYGAADAYEQLKAMTRGKAIDQATLAGFITSLGLPAEANTRLLELTPASYIGLAAELARGIE